MLAAGFLLAALSMAGASAQTDRPPSFVDVFAAVDQSRWQIADGWSNGDWTANDWRAAQVRLLEPGLEVTLAHTGAEPKAFSSGELQSRHVYQYGYYEVRMRAPRGSGLVSGFFTYVRDEGERSWDEIDIEILGRDTRAVQFTYFISGRRHMVTRRLPFDAAEDFHTYGFEWTPGAIRWYVDGVQMHEERAFPFVRRIPQRPQRLYLHLWNSETLTEWLGPIHAEEGPWTLQVACIAHAERYRGRPLCPR